MYQWLRDGAGHIVYVTLDKGMVAFSPEDATIPAIIQSKQYKIRIRRYVSSTEPNKILFKKDLSYLQCNVQLMLLHCVQKSWVLNLSLIHSSVTISTTEKCS